MSYLIALTHSKLDKNSKTANQFFSTLGQFFEKLLMSFQSQRNRHEKNLLGDWNIKNYTEKYVHE